MVEIIPVETPSLGDRSYLAHDGEVALVVDPQRDYDRVTALAAREGVRITHVVETHIHNDYVTGGLALAQEVGAAYHVGAEDPVAYERVPTRDGDVIEVSPAMTLTAIATPGHTFTHLSYALSSHGQDLAVFTGGSLLFGSTGRPDLLGPEHTHSLVHAQYASAHRLAERLGDHTQVYPTHGFGSFCSATQSEATASTIGQERRSNPALTQDEEEWVADLLAGLDAYPAYYAHMGPANLAGPHAPDLEPPAPADAAEIRRRVEAGEWVVDLRNRKTFAAGFVPGTFNVGIDGQFSTYVGWLMPWGSRITLLGETPEQVAEAQRELARIGVDEIAGGASGHPREWTDGELATLPRATFADLADVLHHRRVTVLDVRREPEYADGHVAGALNIPIHEVLDRLDEVPEGEVWVHCVSGYRASVVASILDAAGRRAVAVDDDFTTAEEVGLA
ncbi:MBL fold metallo-hydrolase [Phycicoccus endophyticus]|uniref:MBL fold metallo-hydrolase n=1 Tax=Phycicoccus endophyticus TaxID=1690220 RepID=A0A7G9R0H6_9MICO|nr:MBL fold metallo-hydrolase [Phycicoccus endophyticus]NHI19377.1 MBL fold metallo-hydrolase [Phycicoccus endophyticus]QNN49101.1 MBL fold metallo-hydrolase [Phycicoccus endophyticus]GGL38585.1 MBL fold metallo-hydrolase [Phycicoccus endophyticus]